MSELEPPVTNKELTDQKPFVIRGHHLPYFASLVNRWQYGDTPQRLARHVISDTGSPGNYYNDAESRQRRKKQEEYAQDVLGVGLEQADRFEKHLARTFEHFLHLPDNCPTEIVEEIPDIICAGCAIGKHCYPSRLDIIPTLVTGDTECIDAFLRRVGGIIWLSKLRGENQLPELTIQKQALFSDAEPNVRKINTTLGVVKKVLTRQPNEKDILFRLF